MFVNLFVGNQFLSKHWISRAGNQGKYWSYKRIGSMLMDHLGSKHQSVSKPGDRCTQNYIDSKLCLFFTFLEQHLTLGVTLQISLKANLKPLKR